MNGWLLQVEAPVQNWCQDVPRRFPGHHVRVDLIVPSSAERCVETVTVTGPKLDEFVAAVEEHPHVQSLMVTGRDDHAVQLRLGMGGCPVADLTRTVGLAPRLPFVVLPGKDVWIVVGQDEILRQARNQLARQNVSSELVAKGDWARAHRDMTEHQRSVLGRAVQAGYYEYPRRTTLTRLARELGVAKSTLSQSLMMIEMKLVFDFMERPHQALERVDADDGSAPSSRRRGHG